MIRVTEAYRTNLQLLLSIGIPSLLVILAWLSNNTRLSAHEKRFDDLTSRFDGLSYSFDGLTSRFNDVISAQHKDALEIMRRLTALHERVAVVEANQARRA